MPTRRPALALAAALTFALVATGCSDPEDGAAPKPDPTTAAASPTVTPSPTDLTLGVYGSPEEAEAWKDVVAEFNESSETGEVTLKVWKDKDTAFRAVRRGEVPDVFMSSREDLDHLLQADVTRPVSELLDERGVDFGDRFSRDAVQSYGVDDELQCMAYSVSPMVLYVNTKLVDFAKMERRGLDVPARWDRWSLAQFATAADFAARPRRGTAGFHIDATIEGLAPFITSGGGSVWNDSSEPTSLSFSDDASRAALEQSLAVLRDASLTLTEEQLARHTPLEWFKRGKLGMIAGYRDLVPELRAVRGLWFDVVSMPTLETSSTSGDVTGLCMSAKTEDAAAAADLIAYLVGDGPVEQVTAAGSMVPANLSVAGSDAFLQRGRQPIHSRIFNIAVRGMVIPPLVESWDELEDAVAPQLQELLTAPGELDLDAVTEQVDEASRTVLEREDAEETEAPAEQ
ncbi:ABC transporter substrate-binding protein [Nocardioides houyundeii]|uniref:ABC transporter substrate-binding protein n=1 Tax=Nocardioides houyundeii TaxID=2045452 RepID=UPI000DF1FD29|nr:extracellular solute-binding protein [Nocardioides houyundeii]